MMSEKKIKEIKDADLRAVHGALLRAARSARELARRTGTRLVVSRNGKVEYVTPYDAVQEPPAPYEKK